MYPLVQSSLPSYFPETDEFVFMDFLLADLEELLNSKNVQFTKQLRAVHRDMGFLRSFLEYMGDEHNEHLDLKSLVSRIVQVAYQVEYIISSFYLKR